MEKKVTHPCSRSSCQGCCRGDSALGAGGWFQGSGCQQGAILPPRGHLAMAGDISHGHDWGRMLLVSSVKRSEMLLNIQQQVGQLPTTKDYLDQNVNCTLTSDSRTIVCTRVTWRASQNPHSCDPSPEFLIQQVWSGTQESASVTSSLSKLMLLVWGPYLENQWSI